ncbi:nucleoside recognition domain-containing protein [Virgibacillus halodenitrificans]|uniref:Spore maturation protein n=1 Tax=Virgibacillus halodenitrificans TaxID=1482 RepID=A0ABR7VQ35_VIRHA|nr:nucleoside recognition domain-containing protein [Virgibacillus halodenitrificans]MBD1222652.1 spore maturation protein [Virgibacillus halodenitrificans]MCG1028263.1 spore maturation protein [Virgibacillus halodenitrificans]MCJ0930965.1 spore maturation protein [Virgibacillus halodenitrificans]MYL46962.1 spore maturation protein [Virgibacillus halodenitrificans]MYL57688.1 spore maturation protein [Virgibacillus halodenitrificans]
MVNIIWASMAIIGIIYAMFNGTMEEVNKALFASAQEAVTLSIGLISVLVFWLGIMKVAEEAGILKFLAKLFRPFVTRLFPEVPKDHPAMGYILSNFTANIFGLGNAATPLGIKAMEQMKQLSGSETASRSMITFLALNTSSLTIIPTTVIAIRMQYDSVSPTEIVGTTIIATVISSTGAILIDRFFAYRENKK